MSGHRLIAVAVLAATTYYTNAVLLGDIHISYKVPSDYYKIWDTEGSGSTGKGVASIWGVNIPRGYCSLGDLVSKDYKKPSTKGIVVINVLPEALVHPTSFQYIWNDQGSRANGDVAIYNMTAPAGYTCLGSVAMSDYYTKPDRNRYCCVKIDYIVDSITFVQQRTYEFTKAQHGLKMCTVEPNSVTPSGVAGDNFISFNTRDMTLPRPTTWHLLNKNSALIKECNDIDIKKNECTEPQ